MIIIQFMVWIFFFVGGYFLVTDLCPQATKQARAAVLSYTKRPKATLQSISYPWAVRLQRYVRIGKYKRIKLANTLKFAGFDTSPELYIAQAFSTALLWGLMTVPISIPLSPLLAIIFTGLAIIMYINEAGKAGKMVKKKRENIEAELPHFASTIAEEFKYSRDVVRLFSTYGRVCSPAFRTEIDITLADMRTGNRSEAIGRLSNRVGSMGLSKICRGLQSAMDGYDSQVYFEIVAHDLENEQDQQTERFVQKLFTQIKPYSFMLLGTMVLILMTAIGIYMFNLLKF